MVSCWGSSIFTAVVQKLLYARDTEKKKKKKRKILEVQSLTHDRNLFLSLYDQITQHTIEARLISQACDLNLEEPCAWLNVLLSLS